MLITPFTKIKVSNSNERGIRSYDRNSECNFIKFILLYTVFNHIYFVGWRATSLLVCFCNYKCSLFLNK